MKKFLAGFGIAAVVLSVLAWTPTDRNFNRNQFGTNNLSINIKSGATTTNLLHYGSNYFGGPVYHGGGNGVAYFTNGFVVFDSVEQYSGDYIMIDPGSEFIGAHRGDGQYLTNIPQAGVSGLVAALAAKADTNNVTIWNLDARGFQTDSITNLAGNVFALFASGGGFYFYDPNAGNPFMAGDDTTVSLYANAVEVFAGKEDYTEVMAQNTTNKLHISEDGNIFTGPISANGITNSATTDAIIYADANGRHREVTIGANLSFSAGTLSATGGGGGSGSNGISYVNYPFIGTQDDYLGWLKFTNGTLAMVVTNDGGNSYVSFNDYDTGEEIVRLDNNMEIKAQGSVTISEQGNKKIIEGSNNARALYDGSGTDVAVDFSSATGVQINGIVLNTPSWDIGEFLWIDGGGVVSGTSNLPLASLTVTGNAVVEGQVIGNGQGITNLIYAPNTVTLFETNAAILTNCVSFLTVTNHVRFTNWASVAVAGQWFNVFLTNSTGNNYYIDVPTNGFTRNMTNSTGSYVVADASGTNFACLLTNGQRARLVGEFVGGNLNAATFYFRHW